MYIRIRSAYCAPVPVVVFNVERCSKGGKRKKKKEQPNLSISRKTTAADHSGKSRQPLLGTQLLCDSDFFPFIFFLLMFLENFFIAKKNANDVKEKS